MRFFGAVGYGESSETEPGSGVWVPVITEAPYKGDVIRDTRDLSPSEKVNTDLSVNNLISVVADEKLNKHFYKIKYVVWQGVYWVVTSIEVKPPRLLLTLGDVYNGPTA